MYKVITPAGNVIIDTDCVNYNKVLKLCLTYNV